MKQSSEVKTKRPRLASPFSIHFSARLKPLGWSSPNDLCAAGGKNPAFGLLAAIYAGVKLKFPYLNQRQPASRSPFFGLSRQLTGDESANFVNRTSHPIARPSMEGAHWAEWQHVRAAYRRRSAGLRSVTL
jgi:hypothetical protein